MKTLKKLFIISILVIGCVNNLHAVESCGIPSLDTSIGGTTAEGYTRLNGNAGRNESNYGLTTGSGEWATQFSYGTVWGMSKCSETAGDNSSNTWPKSSKSNWLKTPSDTNGQYCWCQATGFTATASSYTSGPQCTTTASSLWVYDAAGGSSDNCAYACTFDCADRVRSNAAFRAGLFGSVPADLHVALNWYNNGTQMSGGPSSCVVGGTFTPPTPPARPGYIFAGWRQTCASKIKNLDTSIGGTADGYTRLNGSAGSNESNYGLTTGSGEWAIEFSYGTVWGMAKCSETAGDNSSNTWPESSKSNWLKTPSDTNGQYCWCQATGFTATASSYTSGPQCTTTASSLWVFRYDHGSSDHCANYCARGCAYYVRDKSAFRAGVFRSVAQ